MLMLMPNASMTRKPGCVVPSSDEGMLGPVRRRRDRDSLADIVGNQPRRRRARGRGLRSPFPLGFAASPPVVACSGQPLQDSSLRRILADHLHLKSDGAPFWPQKKTLCGQKRVAQMTKTVTT